MKPQLRGRLAALVLESPQLLLPASFLFWLLVHFTKGKALFYAYCLQFFSHWEGADQRIRKLSCQVGNSELKISLF